jgi:hypothetical protein
MLKRRVQPALHGDDTEWAEIVGSCGARDAAGLFELCVRERLRNRVPRRDRCRKRDQYHQSTDEAHSRHAKNLSGQPPTHYPMRPLDEDAPEVVRSARKANEAEPLECRNRNAAISCAGAGWADGRQRWISARRSARTARDTAARCTPRAAGSGDYCRAVPSHERPSRRSC